MMLSDVCLSTEVSHVTRDLDTTLKVKRSNVKVTRPLCSPPCWRVRRLQRWAWERVGRGKLPLRWRLLGGARHFGAHGVGERGGGISWRPHACSLYNYAVYSILTWPDLGLFRLFGRIGLPQMQGPIFAKVMFFFWFWTFSCINIHRNCVIQDRETLSKQNSKSLVDVLTYLLLFWSVRAPHLFRTGQFTVAVTFEELPAAIAVCTSANK